MTVEAQPVFFLYYCPASYHSPALLIFSMRGMVSSMCCLPHCFLVLSKRASPFVRLPTRVCVHACSLLTSRSAHVTCSWSCTSQGKLKLWCRLYAQPWPSDHSLTCVIQFEFHIIIITIHVSGLLTSQAGNVSHHQRTTSLSCSFWRSR